ncbi:MAG: hypothetical protein KatS3mg127_0990 [Silanimonas sp.]|nr:MAG: hypothetical protein KatS3mg127_0990 [Silanimonas sp.]
MPADASHLPLPFRQLKLRPKTLLQVGREGDSATPSEWQFCAAIEGKGLMLAPLPGARMSALPTGAGLQVQGFTGQYDFHFKTSALGTFEVPFAYTLLAWPEEVRGRLVRQALRVRTLLPAQLSALPGGGEPRAAAVLDLSLTGALVETPAPVGALGESLRISFVVEVEGDPLQITTEARICHHRAMEGPSRQRLGLSFRALPRQERLALAAYLHGLAASLDA